MHPMEDSAGDSAAEGEMPRYVSHKKVWALEIKYINRTVPGKVTISFMDVGYAPITFDENDSIFSRYKPIQRDFYVVYQDSYKSFSPRKAFLEGYTRDEPKRRSTIEELEKILQEPDRQVNINPDGSIS